jgi:hypothetical protein
MTKKHLGFYLHTSWEYKYPFAVRSWARDDFQKFFALLETLGFDLVMFWPLSEAMPVPLSQDDRRELEAMRNYVDDAHAHGLEFWATFCPNVMVQNAIAEKPFRQRHFYPFKTETRLDDAAQKEKYFAHRAEVFSIFNNADAYVSIDGDPGGYAGATPETFVEVFWRDRQILDALGRHDAKVVPWRWAGWGGDWSTHGPWNEPLEPLTEPILEALKKAWPQLQPCELLPGRSMHDIWANGRKNFAMTERAGLTEQSTLLCYEIIEYEPMPPAVGIQFDDIRRVLRQEKPLLDKARGVMGNAQQPIMALPNLFFFARVAQEPEYSQRSDREVLRDLAMFLGGDEDVLVPAWEALRRDASTLPTDLPQRLRKTKLNSAAAQNLPGGAQKYLEILAAFVEARLGVLQACELTRDEDACAAGLAALKKWWEVHRYVFSGESGTEFSLAFTHPLLRAPLEARGLK